MNLKQRVKNSDSELYIKKQALYESLHSADPKVDARAFICGVLVAAFVLGVLTQRLVVSPGKALSSVIRLGLSPLSFFRIF